ncbi:hypothetical protein T4B_11534 [Trichinella pseudospiralis]|uniref:Uncharacterized protein n=1 Tax=Trichinella pseudospiralis TaxID=6337 RepID=A0A0V1IM33_TRIPS|nr:hypothetical protein T4B_11534 [Trichinella pseudospiralis]
MTDVEHDDRQPENIITAIKMFLTAPGCLADDDDDHDNDDDDCCWDIFYLSNGATRLINVNAYGRRHLIGQAGEPCTEVAPPSRPADNGAIS